MRQGLCNGTVSVRPSVGLSDPAIDRCNSVRRVCCCGPGGQETSIDCCTAAPRGNGAAAAAFATADHRLIEVAVMSAFALNYLRQKSFDSPESRGHINVMETLSAVR